MGLYNGAVITSAGQNLLAQAISGTELTWTVMRASSVAIPEGTDLMTLTALTGIEQTSGITDASVYGSNVVQVSARFSNTGISEAYLMETIGIYGQVTGGSETLIAVMTAETPDEMPVYDQDSPSAFIFNVQMSVQNANSLTMVVNDTGTATVADLNRKVNLNGGDLSDTVVDTFTDATAEYPVPAAGDTMKVIGGKIAKFCADIVSAVTTLGNDKLDKTGDAQNAIIGASTASTASYPIPAAGDSFQVILGKIAKFFGDIKAAYTSVSVSGKKITFTTAAGGIKEITTQDTVYDDFTKSTASAAGEHGLVPAPAAGKQGQFLRGDATWATPTNTTYTAGTALTLSGTTINHDNYATAGTAGQSSASSGRNTIAIPYVTYNAQGHVTAGGTHTHTIANMAGASASAAGSVGLVPAPAAGENTYYFRGDGSWQAPVNNATATAAGRVLDARMGKTLNDKIGTEKSNIIKHTQANATLNTSVLDTTKTNSVTYVHFETLKLVQVSFDVYMKAGTNTDNSAYFASGLPKSSVSSVFIGRYDENGAFGVGSFNVNSTGQLRPWYRGTPSYYVHCFGSCMYTCT